MSATTVSLSELQNACHALLDQLAVETGAEVQLAVDAYWQFGADARFRVYEPPSGLSVGHVSEDIADLRQALSDGFPDLADGLTTLARILLAVAATAERGR